jgi:hypothetical protein
LLLPGWGGLVLGHSNAFRFENLKPTPDHRLRFRSKCRNPLLALHLREQLQVVKVKQTLGDIYGSRS